jgi:hypothetical protein
MPSSPERPERDEKPGAARVLNPLYRERLFAQIDGAPFVRHMGMRITDLAWGRATFEMTPRGVPPAAVRRRPRRQHRHPDRQRRFLGLLRVHG